LFTSKPTFVSEASGKGCAKQTTFGKGCAKQTTFGKGCAKTQKHYSKHMKKIRAGS